MNRRAYRKAKEECDVSYRFHCWPHWRVSRALAAILWTLISTRLGRYVLALCFTQMTPPPGNEGGLLNAFVRAGGVMTLLGILIGSPMIGVLAGTYPG